MGMAPAQATKEPQQWVWRRPSVQASAEATKEPKQWIEPNFGLMRPMWHHRGVARCACARGNPASVAVIARCLHCPR
jgi:hypothetical protein